MDKAVACKILEIQERFREDPDYQSLLVEHEVLNARFLKMAETLMQEQKEAVFDYIGLLIEIHLCVLEYAVS